MNISIIGAGSWGSALGRILADNSHNVMLYDLDESTINQINTTHTTPKLPNGKLPTNIVGTTNISVALNFAREIVICVPTKVLRPVLKTINESLNEPKLFINASKGVEPETLKRVSQIVADEIDERFIEGNVAIYGPTHAEEVIEQKLTLACAVADNKDQAKLVQKLFHNSEYFRMYCCYDMVGAELCCAIKNVYALASGMLTGLGYGDNARAGLIARALVELKSIVVAMGGEESTVYGLTGIGDLIVTASSHHSRNFQAGLNFAKGNNLDQAVSSVNMVVEGVRTAKSVYNLCKKLNLDCPIINAIYKVVYENYDIHMAIKELMSRPLKAELDDDMSL